VELTEVSIDGFRNLAVERLVFSRAVNLVLGANGAGKTSLLEAVVVLGNLRSFREPVLRRAVRHGRGSFRIQGKIRADKRDHTLTLVFETGPPPRRTLTADGRELSVDQYLQVFPVFAVTGPDRELIYGGPEERRALLDRFVFLVHPGHIDDLRTYRRLVRQRNAALGSNATDAELTAWETQLAAAAGRLVTARAAGTEVLARHFAAVHHALAGKGSPKVGVEYRADPWCEAQNHPEKVEETYRQRYNETRTRDRQTGFTVDGPHRHDLSLRTDGRVVRHVLSTGQAKVVAAALRLASLVEIEKERQDRFPVIVDDVDAELDHEALTRLVNYLGDKRQLFLSSTSDGTAASRGWEANRLWLEDGVCVRQEGEIDE
jgi:DNA replication and repair protein RecF